MVSITFFEYGESTKSVSFHGTAGSAECILNAVIRVNKHEDEHMSGGDLEYEWWECQRHQPDPNSVSRWLHQCLALLG